MAVLVDKLTFLQQLPLLLKGTSDDDTPCPGYLYEEMAKISHESSGSCQCLLEYLLNRLQNNSCHVKLKVLKILLYLCSHGSNQIIQDLRRNAVYIQEASAFSGPPDPLHGISLYQKVRAAGQELVGSLYTDPRPRPASMVPNKERCQPGMGSQVSRSQGFGYSQEKQNFGTPSEALLSGIHRAAIAVTQKVLVGAGSPSSCLRDQAEDTYRPVAVPLGERSPSAGKPLPPAAHSIRGGHRSGVPGGGWDDSDSGHSSQDSLQDKSPRSLSSDAGSKAGSDGQSRSSNRENAEMSERVEPAHPGDCLQEAQLVLNITRGQKVFLTQEEVQHFVRGCSLLNCEVVFEMLNRSLEDDSAGVKLVRNHSLHYFRSMCAIASLMTSDLLSHDHMLAVVRNNLMKLGRGPPGPVKDKARKILLQFEALTQTSPKHGTVLQLPTLPSTQPNPLDLLTDTLPETGVENLLTPSSIPTSPIAASDPTKPACCGPVENGGQNSDGGVVAAIEKDDRVQTEAHGRFSLFDGMELVTPVRRLGKEDGEMTSQMPSDTSSVWAESQERTCKPGLSAFSFLNSQPRT
ncbi:AP-4 complex accessory subunit tepsin isoform X1 [Bufo bufo]|uniref:AP-4 complex accessory subunit tepsin isoform X1 n=1 Tax=Bufo bufo TaxID=8384 RepID=UPI001ABE872E|nr:AP-4 complex accessory subunit tepsin isoform X1 [Bufo bufo]